MRSKIDKTWDEEIWPKIEDKAENLSVVLQPPRRAEHQTMRANTPGSTKEYFKRTIAIPILDAVISSLTKRFGADQRKVANLLTLSPQILINRSTQEVKADLDEAIDHFAKV